ncbi:hypothetical protein COV06_01535 [Candidatus Uhrbacteria bacterium CG10_big_fil_rev_8_21_14_0_10_50_16]|uniref:Glycosyltransferase 2-like domain-containing protein n=1 Tax=Candidatus Uhrbacteria bacterium CG10_big_fil_rev_8_21_14_0_10_50_16 TaxID=1975039 RepID=A0A2H0RNE2_9BACT|nr:MAG: hypothetical protein COV06_01535 [Candidatus Uhrbacteria bacterium CG10_big_fil_rev_8_21_14_0_10_50_16]
MIPRVSVHLVTCNNMTTLPEVLKALSEQTLETFRLRVIDNASVDGLAEMLRHQSPSTVLVRNPNNKGVAVAQNQGVRLALQATGDQPTTQAYVLCLGIDTVLDAGCLDALVDQLDKDPTLAAVGPLILKLFEENRSDEALRERVESDHLASAGRFLTRGLAVEDRGKDEVNQNQYEGLTHVFALSDACVLLRLSALESIQHTGKQFFDTDFKTEECFVDLAWRLQRAGWGIAVTSDAHAYTFSGVYGEQVDTRKHRLRGLRQRDRLLCLAKHVSLGQVLRRSASFFIGDVLPTVKMVVGDRYGLSYLRSIGTTLPSIRKKRQEMKMQQREPVSVINGYIV